MTDITGLVVTALFIEVGLSTANLNVIHAQKLERLMPRSKAVNFAMHQIPEASNSTVYYRLKNANMGKDDAKIERRIFISDNLTLQSYDLWTVRRNMPRQKRGLAYDHLTGDLINIRPECIDKARYIFRVATKRIPLRISSETLVVQGNEISGILTTPSYLSVPQESEFLSWKITYPPANKIMLDLIRHSFGRCCAQLRIHDGDEISDPLVGVFDGVHHPDQSFTVYGSGSSMLLRYESTCAVSGQGFAALYHNVFEPTEWNATKYVPMHCGTISYNINNETGWISSPNFPESYSTDMNCEWELYTPMGSLLQLDFLYFRLPQDEHDHLEIRYGKHGAKLSDTALCNGCSILIDSNIVSLSFRSDRKPSCGYGFNISLQAIPIGQKHSTTQGPSETTTAVAIRSHPTRPSFDDEVTTAGTTLPISTLITSKGVTFTSSAKPLDHTSGFASVTGWDNYTTGYISEIRSSTPNNDKVHVATTQASLIHVNDNERSTDNPSSNQSTIRTESTTSDAHACTNSRHSTAIDILLSIIVLLIVSRSQ